MPEKDLSMLPGELVSHRTGLPDPFLSTDWDIFTRFSALPPGGHYVPGLHTQTTPL